MSPSNSLEQLRRLETGSSRFPAQIASILDGTEYRDSIETLQDEELMWLVEYLNNVRPDIPPLLLYLTSA